MLGERLGIVLHIDELMYLNSGIDNKVPFGINYSILKSNNLKETIDKVKEALAHKGLLDSDYDLKEKGFNVLTLLHKYKLAKEILKINDVHLIDNKENDFIYIKQVDKENYELGVMKKKTVLLSISLNYPFLFTNEGKEKKNITKEKKDEIKNKLESEQIRPLILRKIDKDKNLHKEFNQYLSCEEQVIRHNLLNDTMEVVTKEDTDRDLFYILNLTLDI